MSNDPSAGIIALIVIIALVLVMRWVFKPTRHRVVTRPVDATDSTDLGMLTVIETGVSRQDALRRRATLGEANIRSSMSRRRDTSYDVLVFNADADTARTLLNL